MKDIKSELDKIKGQHPNFVDMAAHEVFPASECEKRCRSAAYQRLGWLEQRRKRTPATQMESRKTLRIGIPRVLNIYTYAPLFNGYFESLGVQPENIVYSDYTTQELYRAGASRGAIDPCFPAKIGISHVYNLIQEKHRKKPLNVIFFPMYDVLSSPLVKIVAANACPDRNRDSGNREGCVH